MRAAGNKLFHISDATDTLITIKLPQYRKNSTSSPVSNFSKNFRWRNLEFDTRKNPGSVKLRKAADAEVILRKLCDHPALKSIP